MGRSRGNTQELVHPNIYNIAAVEVNWTFQVFFYYSITAFIEEDPISLLHKQLQCTHTHRLRKGRLLTCQAADAVKPHFIIAYRI